MSIVPHHHHRMLNWSLHAAGLAVVALLICSFYFLVYQPLQQKHEGHLGRISQLEQLKIATEPEARSYRELRSELHEMKASIVSVRENMTAESAAEQLVSDITQIAKEEDLQLLGSQIGETTSLASHSQTEIEFQCFGSYASICKFLFRAEQLTKAAKLSNFELQATKKLGEYPIQMTFVLYSGTKSHDTKKKRGIL